MFELKGMLSLQAGGRMLGGSDRIELLARIGETGSITAAARAVGMSYKGAWDAVDAMNNLADEPLVVRAAGGRHGGGTRLTARGEQLVRAFAALEQEHRRFVERLSALDEVSIENMALVGRLMIRTSARNQLAGKVAVVRKGAVNDLVELEIAGGDRIVATITSESTETLRLAPGAEAVALIKASSVLIGLPEPGMRLSARNQLAGRVTQVTRGAVNTEVRLALRGGSVVVAIITNDSAQALGLAEGQEAIAVIKASSIILGTSG
ncbi:TOBE domain-containing protein [Dyella sp. C9]|uniref:TOBE domain-containing protein n=1 Tax=Dyella sp. C9 TaxID=2202154 RepID=UPI000DEF2CEA|nr:TOBE domain-containing protein [Dyella sp. C9]